MPEGESGKGLETEKRRVRLVVCLSPSHDDDGLIVMTMMMMMMMMMMKMMIVIILSKCQVRPVVWRPMSLDRREPMEEGDTHRIMDMDRPW